MSAKGKKTKSALWFGCDCCQCVICFKDIEEHQSNYCSYLKHTSEIEISEWKLSFIKNDKLYSLIEETKNADVSSITNDVVLLSQSAMQLCKFVIGDNVVVYQPKHASSGGGDINKSSNFNCEVKKVWPTIEGSVTSVFMPKQGIEMSWRLDYGPCIISKLPSLPIPASLITFKLTQKCDVPEKIDHFINLLHYSSIGKIFHQNSTNAINFYGKKIKLMITKIEGSFDSIDDSVNELATGMENMELTPGDECGSQNDSVKFYKVMDNTCWSLVADSSVLDKTLEDKVKLDDVGGYNDIKNELQQIIKYTLRTSSVGQDQLKNKNIKSTVGVLLHGLHGIGKSLLAQALANDTGAYVVYIRSIDLYSKFYGEAEARLQSLFKEALINVPSVIVLDDIDTICPKRSGSDQERRVISALLTSLDSLDGSKVFVIATTSRLDKIDPALRRPGRLDREVELPVPSVGDREEILTNLLITKQKQEIEVNVIKNIAAVAHGYVGADLSAVIAQAQAKAIQSNNKINAEILEWALTQVKPSAMREVYVEVPNVRWSDIGGQDRLKLQLQQAVDWPLKHPEAFTRLGITPPHGVLMFGPPGCSKTMIAKALATESKLNFISIKGPELFSKWVGESERAVRAVFKRARSVAPAIVFLDELDALAGERSNDKNGGANVQERVLAQLLTELDGVEPLSNVTIIAATNRPDRIDKALLRPGRLDRLIYVPLPDFATRCRILELQFQKIPVSSDVIVDELSKQMDKYSGAEVIAVCHEAALYALEEDSLAKEVNSVHFNYALSMVTPRTPQSLIDLYEKYISQR